MDASLPWPTTSSELLCALSAWFWTLCDLADMLRRIFYTILLAGLSWQAPTRRERTQFGPLRFREDGYFQLSIFEDLHFGESKFTLP